MNDSLAPLLAGISLLLLVLIFFIICSVKIYQKAGYAGWEAFIPIYSTICQINLIGWNPLLVLLILVPGINGVFCLIMLYFLTKTYGISTGVFLLILFVPFIGYPIWALSNKYQYEGPIC